MSSSTTNGKVEVASAGKPGRGRRSKQRLEVVTDAAPGSGRKAARRDLESNHPLGDRTAFQDGLVAGYRDASSNEAERALPLVGEVRESLADVGREIGWREADIESANAEIGDAESRKSKLPESRRISQMPLVAYVALLVLFGVAEYPLLKLSFTRLPVDDRTISMISVLVGTMFVAAVHVLGIVASRVVLPGGERTEGRRDWVLNLAVLSAGVVMVALAVTWLGAIRGVEIAAVGESFGGMGVDHPIWLAAALGLLHALVLLAAFYLAYHRCRGAEARAIDIEIDELSDRNEQSERALEVLERKQERLFVRLETLETQIERRLERLLRHHQHEEAEYLAVLRRELEAVPSSVADWNAIGSHDESRQLCEEYLSCKTDDSSERTTAAKRVKRSLRNHDRGEGTQ